MGVAGLTSYVNNNLKGAVAMEDLREVRAGRTVGKECKGVLHPFASDIRRPHAAPRCLLELRIRHISLLPHEAVFLLLDGSVHVGLDIKLPRLMWPPWLNSTLVWVGLVASCGQALGWWQAEPFSRLLQDD